jgi:hypothetical protein
MAAVDLKKELSDEVMSNVFSHFDRKNDGFITAENLLMALNRTGVTASLSDIKLFVNDKSLTFRTKIDYSTFKAIMLLDQSPCASMPSAPTINTRIDKISRFNVKHLEFDDFTMAVDFVMARIEEDKEEG